MRRLDRAASIPGAVVILFLAVPCVAQTPATAQKGAQLFVDKCSACHSVGGGDLAGPDLVRATRLSPAAVRAALKRMQDNVGPLTGDEVEALAALLKNPNAKAIVAAAENPQETAKTAEVERGSPQAGQRLFYGHQRFENGGTPCFACHAVAGRGGNLAVDLTLVRSRMEQTAFVSVARQPGFPLMKASYSRHPITEAEAFDLAAFLKESGAAAKPGAQPPERTDILHGAAAGAAVVVLAGVGFIFRSRRAGLRSRMVRDTFRPKGE